MKLKLLILILSIFPFYIFAQFNPLINTCVFLDFNYHPEIEGIGGIGSISSNGNNEIGLYKNPALLNANDRSNGIIGAVSSHFSNAGNYNSGIYFSLSNKLTLGYIYNYLNVGELMSSYYGGTSVMYYDYYQSLRASYSLSEDFRFGAGIKHVHSNTHIKNYNINSYAVDLGCSYSKTVIENKAFSFKYDLGADIQNLGPRVSYSDDVSPDFIPTSLNLALGLSPKFHLSEQFSYGLNSMYQVSKLSIPTPPIYKAGSDGFPLVDDTGEFIIESGRDPDVSVFKGMIQSFYDAPGGVEEELNEIMHRLGFESWVKYRRFEFALRYGRFFEDNQKGNRNIRSIGIGLGLYNFKLDYFSSNYLNSNFENTWGISCGYRFKI